MQWEFARTKISREMSRKAAKEQLPRTQNGDLFDRFEFYVNKMSRVLDAFWLTPGLKGLLHLHLPTENLEKIKRY